MSRQLAKKKQSQTLKSLFFLSYSSYIYLTSFVQLSKSPSFTCT